MVLHCFRVDQFLQTMFERHTGFRGTGHTPIPGEAQHGLPSGQGKLLAHTSSACLVNFHTFQRDVLQTMDVCLPVFGPVLARALAKKTWNHLRLEIFQPTDPETEAEALKTLQVLIKTIYADADAAQNADADIQGLAKEACEECIHILREPEKSQAKPAIKVICAFMSTTRVSSSTSHSSRRSC